MADSYIKSYLACEKAYYGLNGEPVYPDPAAREAQQNFENYLKNLKNGAGALQGLYNSYGQGQTITDNYLEVVDEAGHDVYVKKYMSWYDDNKTLELPPNYNTYLGTFEDEDPPSDTPHSLNSFTAQFLLSLPTLMNNSVLDQLRGGLSDDDFHFTLGNLTSAADQEKLVAVREKIQPLVTFFTALQKSAIAVNSNPGESQNVTLDLPDGSLYLNSPQFAQLLHERLYDLINLGS